MKSVFFLLALSSNLLAAEYTVRSESGYWWSIECKNQKVVKFAGNHWPYMQDLELQPLYPFGKDHQGVQGGCHKESLAISLWYSDEEVTQFAVNLKSSEIKVTHRDGAKELPSEIYRVSIASVADK